MTSGAPRRGPGPVVAAHKLLIASALVCALVYAAWEAREFARTGEGVAVVIAGLALAAAGGLAVYLRSLRGLRAKLTAVDEARHDA